VVQWTECFLKCRFMNLSSLTCMWEIFGSLHVVLPDLMVGSEADEIVNFKNYVLSIETFAISIYLT